MKGPDGQRADSHGGLIAQKEQQGAYLRAKPHSIQYQINLLQTQNSTIYLDTLYRAAVRMCSLHGARSGMHPKDRAPYRVPAPRSAPRAKGPRSVMHAECPRSVRCMRQCQVTVRVGDRVPKRRAPYRVPTDCVTAYRRAARADMPVAPYRVPKLSEPRPVSEGVCKGACKWACAAE